jgi:hypothetical protein
MFRDNTVFVIGAGASHEFGLPVGETLMKQIQTNSYFKFDFRSMVKGVVPIYRCIVNRYSKDDYAIDARLRGMAEIHRAIDHAGSIDEFINRHTGDEVIAEVGKLQIAYAISEAERLSKLATTPLGTKSSSPPDLSNTWIKSFTQMLFDGVRNSDVETVGSNITIICFNYDRCIETYLEHAIVKTFRDVSPDMARQIVKSINIIHPYGSLGDLRDHPFGAEPTPERIRAMSENIVTWSESMGGRIYPRIHDAMTNATTVVFLGFAFAPQNMKLLEVQNGFDDTWREVETFATAYGYNSVINERLQKKIIDLFSSEYPVISDDKVHIQYDMKCAEFLKAHSMALVV